MDANLTSNLERLANLRGLTAKSTGVIVDVEVDYQAVIEFIDAQYEHLVATYEDEVGITDIISAEDFRAVMLAALGKRVQWVRAKVNGIREGQSIRIDNHLPLPGPLFDLFYAFGRVDSTHNGSVYLPVLADVLRHQVDLPTLRKYLQLHSRLKHYYSFSESLPSQIDGSWAYLIYAEVIVNGTSTASPTDEPRPADAYLAAAIRCARLVAGQSYNITYGVLPFPEVIRASLLDAYGKGVGDAR